MAACGGKIVNVLGVSGPGGERKFIKHLVVNLRNWKGSHWRSIRTNTSTNMIT